MGKYTDGGTANRFTAGVNPVPGQEESTTDRTYSSPPNPQCDHPTLKKKKKILLPPGVNTYKV